MFKKIIGLLFIILLSISNPLNAELMIDGKLKGTFGIVDTNTLTITGTLGTEKATDGTFAAGTCVAWTFNVVDWTCGAANIAKDANGTNTLSQNMTEAAGQYVKITFDITGFSAGIFTVAYGASYAQTCDSANGATQSITQYHVAADTTNFTITPSNTSRFTLDNISVKIMSNGGLTLYNPLYVPFGSVGYPSFSLIGDTDSGFFWDANRKFNWVIDGASVASVGSTGEIVGVNYKTIYIPAASMTSTATNGATFGTYEYATNDINKDFYAFDGATEQYVERDFPMPKDWDKGTVKINFYWTSATGSTAGDTCEWEALGGALSDGDTIDAALGSSQVISDTLLANNGTTMHISPVTPALTVGGTPALLDSIHWKISRNVGGTDNMTENAWLFGVWITYLANQSVAAP